MPGEDRKENRLGWAFDAENRRDGFKIFRCICTQRRPCCVLITGGGKKQHQDMDTAVAMWNPQMMSSDWFSRRLSFYCLG